MLKLYVGSHLQHYATDLVMRRYVWQSLLKEIGLRGYESGRVDAIIRMSAGYDDTLRDEVRDAFLDVGLEVRFAGE